SRLRPRYSFLRCECARRHLCSGSLSGFASANSGTQPSARVAFQNAQRTSAARKSTESMGRARDFAPRRFVVHQRFRHSHCPWARESLAEVDQWFDNFENLAPVLACETEMLDAKS